MAPKEGSKRERDDDAGDDAGEQPQGKPGKKEPYADCLPFEDMQKQRPGEESISKNSVDEPAWRHTIAMHMATAPSFVRHYVENRADPDQYIVKPIFLAQVYLRGRYKGYNGFVSWFKNWWPKYRLDIIREAQQTITAAHDRPRTKLGSIRIELPEGYAGQETNDKRQMLFKVHSTVLQLRSIMGEATTTQHNLATSLLNCVADEAANAQERDSLVAELTALEEMKSNLRFNSSIVTAGIEILDQLLTNVTADYDLTVMGVPEPDLEPKTQESLVDADEDFEDSDELSDHELTAIVDAVIAQNNFTADYVNGKMHTDFSSDIVNYRRSNPKSVQPFEVLQDAPALAGSKFIDMPTLAKYEDECAEWLKTMAKGWIDNVNGSDFQVVYRRFEELTGRPEKVRNLPRSSRRWQDHAGYRLSVIEDNIVHVRMLVKRMWDQGLFKKDLDRDELEQEMRRMWALLALAFGTCNEPGLLCSLVDDLLERFATNLTGFVDSKLETVRMAKAMTLMGESSETVKEEYPSLNQGNTPHHRNAMKKDHEARVIFAELARFYRGAFILSVAQVNPGSHHDNEDNKKQWLDQLIQWSGDCGHPSCHRQLKVKKIPYGENMSRWSVSISNDDSRVGFPEERSEISKNRPFAYPCLWMLIINLKYHVGLGPFYHYFTHLYHPTCRPFRGKATILDDIAFSESQG